jgi:glycosyltransferase involved in cell wall biosynthesis
MHVLGIRKLRASTMSTTRRASERFFPDSKVGWVKPAVRLGRALIEKQRYDLLISTSPPVSAHLVAKRLWADFNLPWLADFRDFWTTNRVEEAYPKEDMVRKGKKLLAEITGSASAVTAVNPAIVDYLSTGVSIPNGYDSDLARHWQGQPDDKRFIIGMLGNLHDTRTLEPLLETLSALRDSNESHFRLIGLLQVGDVDKDWLLSILSRYDLEDRCDIRGYLPRRECISVLSEASLFYIGLSETTDLGVVPSRVFDLLTSGRPILAYAPENSALTEVIKKSNNGYCYTSATIPQAADYLDEQVARFALGAVGVQPQPEYAREYSSDIMVQRFAEILDRL